MRGGSVEDEAALAGFEELGNRTGLGTAPEGPEMESLVAAVEPEGRRENFRRHRMDLRAARQRVGTMPPPPTISGIARDALRALRGAPTGALLDKLGERLGCERTATRLYDTLLEKLDQHGSFEGGPTRARLERIRAEEAAHFALLAATIRDLDGDPTAMTPSADLASVAASGVVKVLNDPRTNLAESCEAVLVAELADRDGWVRLIELAEQVGETELARACRRAENAEEGHLASLRSWISAWYATRGGAALE